MTTHHVRTVTIAVATILFAQEAPAQAPPPVWSQSGIAMDRLEPTPPGDPFFSVPSPFVGGRATPRASLTVDYAKNPLVLDDGRAVVSGQTFVHVGFSLAIVDHILASIELPGVVLQSGDAPVVRDIALTLPDSPIPGNDSLRPAVGDLRLGMRARAIGEEDEPVQAALGAYVHIPSFMASSILREPSVRVSPNVLLGGRYENLVWSAALGTVLRSSETPSTLTYGAGAALSLGDDRITLGSEIFASTPLRAGLISLSDTEVLARPALTGAEWLLNARLRLGPMVFGGAVGFGIGHAPGTPSLRALGSIAVSPLRSPPPPPPPADTDEDGTFDEEDRCPYASGPWSSDSQRTGCPSQDRDGDGVPDEGDKCPTQPGSQKNGGCGPDGDDDKVPDALDLCPEAKGTLATAGCPDEDEDGLPDIDDACPKEKGRWHVDSKLNGCPNRPAPTPTPEPAVTQAPPAAPTSAPIPVTTPAPAPVAPAGGKRKGQ